ncbi:MAG: hypothetical protein HY744_18200 [Deltaproteobacteria bacterium]|nr:hypothetical protein [Deltaproteobacteria bacterium]
MPPAAQEKQGAAPQGDEGEPAPAQDDDPRRSPPPATVDELAAACVRYVSRALRVAPDFSRETLPLVDHYLEQAASAAGLRPETLPLTAHTIGAYLGEVVRRTHPCWWRIGGDDPARWRLEFRDAYLKFYPVQVVLSALTRRQPGHEDTSGLELDAEEREGLRARLAELPQVTEAEYYAPSTRLEVIDIALDVIAAARGEPRSYRPADYEQE